MYELQDKLARKNTSNHQYSSLPKLAIITQSNFQEKNRIRKLNRQMYDHTKSENLLFKNYNKIQKTGKSLKCHIFIQLLEKRKKYFVAGSKIVAKSKPHKKMSQLDQNASSSLNKNNQIQFSKDKIQQFKQQIVVVKHKVSLGKQFRLKLKSELCQNKCRQIPYLDMIQITAKNIMKTMDNSKDSLQQKLSQKYNLKLKKPERSIERYKKQYPQSFSFKQKKQLYTPWQVQNNDFYSIQS